MTWESLRSRPDLRSLFGALSDADNEGLIDRLIAIDRRLERLAEEATAHVGVAYQAIGLRFSGSMGVDGGPSGPAGDIWFDLSPSWDPAARTWVTPPWTVESSIIILCSDGPEPRHEANTHRLLSLEGSASTPASAVDLLESQVSRIADAIGRYAPDVYTRSLHANLP